MNFGSKANPLLRMISLVILILALASPTLRADQIVLKNGDRITGTIKSADGGKLIIASPIAGTITVDLKDVKTFSTEQPIKIVLIDGTVINQAVSMGTDGTFQTAPGGALAAQPIPISKIDKINPAAIAWTGSLVVNGSLTQGNTYSEQFGATLGLTRRGPSDRIQADAQYLFGKTKQNGVTSTTTDQWYIQPAYDYFFTKQVYANASVRVEKNRILNLDIRVTPALGAGYQFVEQPDFNADVEGGLAWVYEDYTNTGTPDQTVSLRLAYHVDKSLWTDKVKVFSDCAYFPSIQNSSKYLVIVDGGIHLAVTKSMFTELRGEADYDSHPAPNSHRTQTQLILGVGWTF
jgi:putative salt-induced outer membrane protein YdiY